MAQAVPGSGGPSRWAPVLAGAVVLVVAAALTPVALAASAAPRGPGGGGDETLERGRDLYLEGCASCHGEDGGGREGRGPSVRGSGAAGAHFYLTTGRMPMDEPGRQTRRKEPAYDTAEIRALVAYVAALGEGPEIPQVDPTEGSLARGQQLYTAYCAACHSSAGAGGAVGQNIFAPGVTRSTPTQTATAIRIGPGAMPAFSPGTIGQEGLDDVTRYVEYLQDPQDRGGAPLGRIGPVPEGLVAWVLGMGSLLLVARWIGGRT